MDIGSLITEMRLKVTVNSVDWRVVQINVKFKVYDRVLSWWTRELVTLMKVKDGEAENN